MLPWLLLTVFVCWLLGFWVWGNYRFRFRFLSLSFFGCVFFPPGFCFLSDLLACGSGGQRVFWSNRVPPLGFWWPTWPLGFWEPVWWSLIKQGALAGVVVQQHHMVMRGWGYWEEAGQALRKHWQSAGRGFPGVLGTGMTVDKSRGFHWHCGPGYHLLDF